MGEANRLGRRGVLAAAVLLMVGVLVLATVVQPMPRSRARTAT